MLKIAIDGPAGAGKSTVAKAIAKRFGINYMDTGAMYRAMAYALLEKGVDVNDRETVVRTLPEIQISVVYTEEGQRVLNGKKDITPYIRTPEITKASSDVAVIPEVRVKLVEIQREVASRFDLVMDGRDIGTYVLPDADLKLYITASPRERARRRQKDFAAQGIQKSIEELEREITARDKTDSEREFAPLKQAEDAIYLDTTDLSLEEVLKKVSELVERAGLHV